ncbi:MAG: alanine racemase [bacterium]|nr:alanine racemase [bacterium]
MKIFKFLRAVNKYFSRYQPDIEILVSKNNLLYNLAQFKSHYPKLAFAPVLKSNGYGHGLAPVARVLDREEIPFFIVDSLYEAMVLRHEGIKTKVLVIGYTGAANINSCNLSKVVFAITSLEQLQQVAAIITKPITIHLKLDTGMRRQGILNDQIEAAAKIIRDCPRLRLEGVCSHLADADNPDSSFTRTQIKEWGELVKKFKENFSSIKYYHLSATAGVYYADDISVNVARLGLGLYGINPSPFLKLDLRPALKMQSVISSVKNIQAGDCVGYNNTYKADKPIKIVSTPVGYFEGVDRRLSNRGFLKIGENFCPIIGRVSMNITTVDASALAEVKLGDKVTVISNIKEDLNSVENLAKLAQTIPYEILVHIPQHLRRLIV